MLTMSVDVFFAHDCRGAPINAIRGSGPSPTSSGHSIGKSQSLATNSASKAFLAMSGRAGIYALRPSAESKAFNHESG